MPTTENAPAAAPAAPAAVAADAAERAAGLRIYRQGDALDRVRSKTGVFKLLLSGENMEVIEGTVKRGEKLTLLPAARGATEGYLFLEGALRALHPLPDALRVAAGDTVIPAELDAPLILTAEAPVRFLFFTSRPFFHEISEKLRELMALAVEVEAKDGYTAEHCLRLQRLSFAAGRTLGLPSSRLYLLDYGAYMHDVGKLRVPAAILQKPAKLDADEWAVIRRHPTDGRELLEPTLIREAGPIVEQHHERLDGSGYPYGLAGDEILPEAYLVAIADTYDAMTTDRPYRRALPPEVAFAELERFAGVHYPREHVRAFRAAVTQLEGHGER